MGPVSTCEKTGLCTRIVSQHSRSLPRDYHRGTDFDDPLASGPPNSFVPSHIERQHQLDNLQAHQHDDKCNHDHGGTMRQNSTFDDWPNNNTTSGTSLVLTACSSNSPVFRKEDRLSHDPRTAS